MDSAPPKDVAARELVLIEAAQREAAELTAAANVTPLPADSVPGYRIIGEIGRGGMGVVYKALQLGTQRIVALKVMLAGPFAAPAARERFRREVVLTARLQHPGIVRVLESGQTSTGQDYYSMDYVDGVPLNLWLSRTAPDVPARLRFFAELADAVEHAHRQGVLHRDLKPANVLVDSAGRPHVLDFGLSKATDVAVSAETPAITVSSPGQIVGTLWYLSPEQAAGDTLKIDARADVYALGVMLYETLTGRLPYDAPKSSVEMLQRICNAAPSPPSTAGHRLDRELETTLFKALEKDPLQRYQSAGEFGEDLRRYLANEPILAQPPTRLYVWRKRVSRHRAGFTVAVAIMGLAAIGAVLHSIWQKQQVVKARRACASVLFDLELGRDLDCLSRAANLYQRFPDLPDARLVTAQAQFRTGCDRRDDKGRELVRDAFYTLTEEIPAKDGWRWVYDLLRADIQDWSGDADKAKGLHALAEMASRETAEDWYLRSLATLDIAEALRCVGRTRQIDPRWALALEREAYLSFLARDVDRTLIATDRLLNTQLDPECWHSLRASAFAWAGRYREAIEAYDRVRCLDGDRAAFLRRRAGLRLCQRLYAAADADHAEALAILGDNLWLHYQRATTLWILGNLDKAVESYEMFRPRFRDASHADARLFLVLCDQDRSREAQDMLRQARTKVRVGWHEQIFDCLLRNGLSPQQLVEAAGADRKKQCEGCYYAGERCRLDGDNQNAHRWFQECVSTGLVFDPSTYPPDPMNEYHLARWRLNALFGEDPGAAESPPVPRLPEP